MAKEGFKPCHLTSLLYSLPLSYSNKYKITQLAGHHSSKSLNLSGPQFPLCKTELVITAGWGDCEDLGLYSGDLRDSCIRSRSIEMTRAHGSVTAVGTFREPALATKKASEGEHGFLVIEMMLFPSVSEVQTSWNTNYLCNQEPRASS